MHRLYLICRAVESDGTRVVCTRLRLIVASPLIRGDAGGEEHTMGCWRIACAGHRITPVSPVKPRAKEARAAEDGGAP